MRKVRVNIVSVVRQARKRLQIDTQRTRLKLLNDLQGMFNMAKGYATNKDTTDKQRQIWTQIMAYTGQVMNSITKSFDEAQVTQDLERLEKLVDEALAKGESGDS